MAAPSRYHTVLSNEHWDAAFGRQSTIEDVLEYILAHWQQLHRRPPADMVFSESEPHITKFFGLSLRKNARAHGIFGYFVPENPVGDIDEIRQVLESRGRTDLTYTTDRLEHPLEFVMEFKKLKSSKSAKGGNASRKAYCADGMLRYVDGIYARDFDLGFMVGLVEFSSQVPDAINGLKRAIQQPDMERLLKLIKDPKGQITVATKKLVFKSCDFETRHARDHVGQSDVLLGHIVLAHRSDD